MFHILLLAFLQLSASAWAQSACPSNPGSATGPLVTVRIPPGAKDLGCNAFGKNPLSIDQGAKVTWSNADTTGERHVIKSDAGLFGPSEIAQGESTSFVFTTPGTFTYHCEKHPEMRGTIKVPTPGGQ